MRSHFHLQRSIKGFLWHSAKMTLCHSAECPYIESHFLWSVMLNVNMLSFIMLGVMRPQHDPLTCCAFIFCLKPIFQTYSFQQIILILANYKVPRYPSLSISLFLTFLYLLPPPPLSLTGEEGERVASGNSLASRKCGRALSTLIQILDS